MAGIFQKLFDKLEEKYPKGEKPAKSSKKRNDEPAKASEPGPMAAHVHQKVLATKQAAGTLTVALQNKTTSATVYAYITGLAIDRNNAPMFIQSDGRTAYFPTSPSQPGGTLTQDVAIALGRPGNTVNVTIPKMAGGRIWFSIDSRLTFKVNPGPAIVEPSVTNPSDPNIASAWGFCEFTFNEAQLFANISYVDFVSIPIALTLTSTAGNTQNVPGMKPDGFNSIVNSLKDQAAKDGRPWAQLIHTANGKPVRILSPNNLLVGNANAWGNYWDAYVNQVWSRFSNEDMIINTQAAAGNVRGRVLNNELVFANGGAFEKPTAGDIFSCNTGPFATGSNQTRNAIIPRLSAAFNRSNLLDSTNQFPNGVPPATYYRYSTTNYYSKFVHAAQKDGRGYAFPYDDVVPDGGEDVAGVVFDGSPSLFTVAVGGA